MADGFSRRQFLSGALAVPGLLCAARPAAAALVRARPETLQEMAGAAHMLFGSAVWASNLADDSAYRTALARQCGIVTPEAELNWVILEPQRGRLDFTGADSIAAFAKATTKTMHGHSLLWHLSIPDWGAEALAEQPDWGIVRRFLSSVVPRYGEVTNTWDVVNEAIEPGHGRADGLRISPYLTAFGPDYIRRAFEDAHMFAPGATLFLNEYGLEYDFPEEEARRAAVLRLLKSLKRSGAPVGGFGLQGHLDLAKQEHFNAKVLADFLDRVGALGLQVRISELDVKEADRNSPIERRDALVGDAAARFLDIALANRAVGSVSCWGISDRYSWLNEPGVINRGLPLDAEFAPTPFFAALKSALARRIG